MHHFRFVAPQKLEDLLHPQDDPSIYYVSDELTSLEIAQKLPEAESRLKDDPLNIEEEFGTFFSVLKNFSKLDAELVDRAWILVYKTTDVYQEQLREIFNVLNESIQLGLDAANSSQSSVSQDPRGNLFESLQEKLRYSNSLKMLIYINCIFIQQFEEALSSESHRQNFNETYSETGAPRRRKKQRANDKDFVSQNYDRFKHRVLKNLLQLISMPLNKLTNSSTESEEIVGQVMRACYKIIENASINNVNKDKDLMDIIFSSLGCGIEKYNQSLSFCLKIIQLLQYKEQLAALLVDLMEFLVTRHDQRLLIGEILREIDRVDAKELSKGFVSTFLVGLSEKCPQEFVPFLEQIFGHLEQESYMMRNASLSVIANIIIKVRDEEKLRDELLDVLQAHTKDITGYTRAKALGLWCFLCEKGCIPNSYIAPVTAIAVNRLLDKSCFVRKNALKFIIYILSRNPFASRLPLNTYVERYQAEKATLDKLVEEDDDKAAIEAQERKIDYLSNAIAFTKQIHRAIPIATELLFSKNVTDTKEAIDFFVHCHEFAIDEALIGFKRMIMLVNVQEESIKSSIFGAYKTIFFESSRNEGKSNLNSMVVQNLINFVQAATIGESLCLEILLKQFLETKDFRDEMKRELWATFTKAKSNTTDEDSIAAIQILGMLATSQPDIINHNLQVCVQYGLSANGCSEQTSRLIRETCIAIRKSLPRKAEDMLGIARLPTDDKLFTQLSEILVESLDSPSSEHWFSMCDEALRVIFEKAEHPEKICESIYDRMASRLLKNCVVTDEANRTDSPELNIQPPSFNPSTIDNDHQMLELVHPIALSRFIHFLGDVALDLAVLLELHVLLELKLRNASKNNNNESINNVSRHNISVSSRRRSRRFGPNKSVDEQNLEEEIGLGGAEAEDAELEFVGEICDEEIVYGRNLLAKVSRVIIEVVSDPNRYSDPELKLASSLALAKFMMVSAKYCHDHLRLLFTILEKTKDHEIKINLLIAISDLCIRFPNQLDGWTSKLFDCLQNEEVSVRRAALKILSRLVLCDILKAKDQISTMANLIVDEDEQISSYSRHFFHELSKKLNAIYNVLPDIISRLSDSKTGISEEDFRVVMKFMFELIDKSHHIDRLVDKLCGRFMDTDDERHWSDLAFCLSLLKYSDKSMTKLLERFDCYKDKLCIDSVHESISSLIANYRKTLNLKPEMRNLLDEFEAKIAKSRGQEEEEQEQEQEQEQAGDTTQPVNTTAESVDTTEE